MEFQISSQRILGLLLQTLDYPGRIIQYSAVYSNVPRCHQVSTQQCLENTSACLKLLWTYWPQIFSMLKIMRNSLIQNYITYSFKYYLLLITSSKPMKGLILTCLIYFYYFQASFSNLFSLEDNSCSHRFSYRTVIFIKYFGEWTRELLLW